MKNIRYLKLQNLTDDEIKIIESIESRIREAKKFTINTIAQANFTSTSSIVNLAKKAGYKGYSDFIFHLEQVIQAPLAFDFENNLLASLVDHYNPELTNRFCALLKKHKHHRIYILGLGFSDITADYFCQKISCYGFYAFRGPHFDMVDVMSQDPSLLICISKTGGSTDTNIPAMHAHRKGYDLITFTSNAHSELVKISDCTILIEEKDERIVDSIPDYFFGKCILAFESLLSEYFRAELSDNSIINKP